MLVSGFAMLALVGCGGDDGEGVVGPPSPAANVTDMTPDPSGPSTVGAAEDDREGSAVGPATNPSDPAMAMGDMDPGPGDSAVGPDMGEGGTAGQPSEGDTQASPAPTEDPAGMASSASGTSSAEDTGYDCPSSSPDGENGGSSSTLPDPFTRWDGTQVQTMEDWRCRRRELVVEVEKRILGPKAAPPANAGGSVTGTVTETDYSVDVTTPDGSTSFSGDIRVPRSGSAPYPAVIVIGGFNTLSSDLLSSEGVATISYNNNAIAAETARNFDSGKYYEANPEMRGQTGALVAWAWGISRIIDVLEQNPDVIDPTRIAVHGCSRLGKAAFVAGAFDQRIALGLPLEPGTGGPAPLRALPVLGGQSLGSANGEASWFGPDSGRFDPSMPVDMSDVAAMYAPRGLLMMDNPHIDHLAYKANFLGAAAAYEVYKAMGREDALWYLGNTSNGNHCSMRSEYADPLRAMIQKFLKGDTSATTGGLDTHANHQGVDVSNWTSTWTIGPISE